MFQNAGYFVLGKFSNDEKTELHLTAFKVVIQNVRKVSVQSQVCRFLSGAPSSLRAGSSTLTIIRWTIYITYITLLDTEDIYISR